MYNNKTFLAIIPARGDSKRLPNKNILVMSGKPLVVWTIESTLKSKYIDETIVSTDSEKIAHIAKNSGASVPGLRPRYLAQSNSKVFDTIKYTLETYGKKYRKQFDYILLLQPTSPLRSEDDIDKAIELCVKRKADSILSVCECEHNPIRSNTLTASLSMNKFIAKKYIGVHSQDLPTYYRLNGSIYIFETKVLLRSKKIPIMTKNTYAYIMPQEKSIDIDTQIDFDITQLLMDKNRNKK